MVDINIINEEIEELEERETSYSVIRRLAMLYTVRDHLCEDDCIEPSDELTIEPRRIR